MTDDQRVTDYIARAADFARPILAHLRAQVATAVPDAGETIKWGMPHFEYKGAGKVAPAPVISCAPAKLAKDREAAPATLSKAILKLVFIDRPIGVK